MNYWYAPLYFDVSQPWCKRRPLVVSFIFSLLTSFCSNFPIRTNPIVFVRSDTLKSSKHVDRAGPVSLYLDFVRLIKYLTEH